MDTCPMVDVDGAVRVWQEVEEALEVSTRENATGPALAGLAVRRKAAFQSVVVEDSLAVCMVEDSQVPAEAPKPAILEASHSQLPAGPKPDLGEQDSQLPFDDAASLEPAEPEKSKEEDLETSVATKPGEDEKEKVHTLKTPVPTKLGEDEEENAHTLKTPVPVEPNEDKKHTHTAQIPVHVEPSESEKQTHTVQIPVPVHVEPSEGEKQTHTVQIPVPPHPLQDEIDKAHSVLTPMPMKPLQEELEAEPAKDEKANCQTTQSPSTTKPPVQAEEVAAAQEPATSRGVVMSLPGNASLVDRAKFYESQAGSTSA